MKGFVSVFECNQSAIASCGASHDAMALPALSFSTSSSLNTGERSFPPDDHRDMLLTTAHWSIRFSHIKIVHQRGTQRFFTEH